MEYLNLNNGTRIPMAGLGTFMLQPDEAEYAVLTALRSGYSLIDTANAYMNEKAVGRGMKKSGVSREKIYLSTKLWPSVYADAEQAIEDTLKRLNMVRRSWHGFRWVMEIKRCWRNLSLLSWQKNTENPPRR